MSMRMRCVAMVAALGVSSAATLSAQTSHAHIGLHGLYNSTFEDWGIGAQFSAPVAHHLEFYPSFDWYFEDAGNSASMWELNGDFKYRALGEKFNWLYIGSGVNYHYQKIDDLHLSRVGWNLLAGAESIRGKIHPFGEARVTVTDHTRFQIQAGINITIGKGTHP